MMDEELDETSKSDLVSRGSGTGRRLGSKPRAPRKEVDMIKLIYGTGIIIGAGLTFISTRTLRQLQRELAQARLLQEQMEEDHITLVRNVIETNNLVQELKKKLNLDWLVKSGNKGSDA